MATREEAPAAALPPPSTAEEVTVVGPAPARSSRGLLLATLAPVVLAIAVTQSWFRDGSFIATGDIGPFVRPAAAADLAWAWNHDVTGAGSASYQVVRMGEVLLIDLVGLLGGGEVVAQRVFYALLLGLVALGTALFVRRFTANPLAVAFGATFACVNPLVLTHVPNPLVLLAIALMGLSGAKVLAAAQGEPPRPHHLAFITLGVSFLFTNPPLVAVLCGWLVLLVLVANPLFGPGASRRAVRLLVRAAPLALALNLWWVVPVLVALTADVSFDVGAVTSIHEWAWTHRRSSLANVLSLNATWAWDYDEYFPYRGSLDAAGWDWLRFVPPFLCFTAPLLATGRRRRYGVVLLAPVLGAVLIGKGLHRPLSGLNLWLYEHVPGFWLFREPIGKVGVVLVVLYATLLAIAATGAADAIASRPLRFRRAAQVGALVVAVAALAYPYPLWNGGLFPEDRPALPPAHVQLPDEWRAAAAYVNGLPADGKALVLPLDDFYQVPTTWGFYGVDTIPARLVRRPTIQPLPGGYVTEPPGYLRLVHAAEDALAAGNRGSARRALRALGVSQVLVRRDLVTDFGGRTFADPSKLAATLSSTDVAGPARSFGVVDVFTVRDRADRAVVQVRPGGPPADAAVADVRWARRNPATYDVQVSGVRRPVLLVLTESFTSGWRVDGLPHGARATHLEVDGYANGWLLEGGREFELTLTYGPARPARWALVVSAAAAALALLVPAARAALRTRRRQPQTVDLP